MRKRIKYNVGDVFLIDLERGLKTIGRVIKKHEATVFLVVYKVKPFADISEIDLDTLVKEPALRMVWCYDTALKNGMWKIVGNIPVEEDFCMPYFGSQTADGTYFLVEGTDTYSGGKRIIVSEEEAKKAYPHGISNEIALPKYCISKFQYLKML